MGYNRNMKKIEKNRKKSSSKLCEGHLSGHKVKNVVTLNETIFLTQNSNGVRKICNTKDGKQPEKYVYQKKEKFSDKLMVVGARTGRGVPPLIPGRNTAKVNSKDYVENILKQF